jgi:putative peptidoglycan lipid II flippase
LPTYQYAQAVYLLPYAVLAVPIATAAFPHLAQAAQDGARAAFARAAAVTTRAVLAAAARGAAVLLAAAPAGEGFFTAIDRSRDVAGLGAALAWFAPGLLGYAVLFHATRVLYAADRPRPAALAAGAGWLAAAALAALGAWA